MTAAPMLRAIREVKRLLLRKPPRLPEERGRFIQSAAFTRSDAWVWLRMISCATTTADANAAGQVPRMA